MRAYLVRIFTVVFSWGGVRLLGLNPNKLNGGAYEALIGCLGLIMILEAFKPGDQS